MQVRAQNPSENPGLLATAAIGVGAALVGAAAGAAVGACAPKPTGYVRREVPPSEFGLGGGFVEVFTSSHPCAPVGQGQEARVIVNTGGGVPPLVFGPKLFANPMDMMAWINEAAGFDVSLAPQTTPAENPTPGGPLGIRRARASNPCSTCGFGVPPNPAGNASSRERRAWAMSQVGGGTPMMNPCDGICPQCGTQHNPRPLTPQEASKVRGGTFNPTRAPLRLRNPYNPGGGGCYPGPQPCDEGREACSYSHYGVLKAGCRHSDTFQIPDSSPTGASPGPSYATGMLMRASPMAARQSRRSRKYALALAGQVATPERVRYGR